MNTNSLGKEAFFFWNHLIWCYWSVPWKSIGNVPIVSRNYLLGNDIGYNLVLSKLCFFSHKSLLFLYFIVIIHKTSCFHLGLYWIHSLHTWLLPLIAFLTAVAPSAHLRGSSFFSHSDSRLTSGIKLSRHDSPLPCVWKLIPPSLAT